MHTVTSIANQAVFDLSNSNFDLGRASGLPITCDLGKVVIPFHPGGRDDHPLTLR